MNNQHRHLTSSVQLNFLVVWDGNFMAIVLDFTCKVCGRNDQTAVGSGRPAPTICNACQKLEDDCKRREHFHGLDGLTLEERIRRIEEWIYDYRPPASINDIRL